MPEYAIFNQQAYAGTADEQLVGLCWYMLLYNWQSSADTYYYEADRFVSACAPDVSDACFVNAVI